jgi:hypothetical protein
MPADAGQFIRNLWQAGLIQAGSFGSSPFQARMELLPSYPELMRAVADIWIEHVRILQPERLLAVHEAAVLAGIVSVATSIPLVVHTGLGGTPVQKVIGAYDVGHPTVLLSLTPPDARSQQLTEASQVGLDVIARLSVFSSVDVASPDHAAVTLAQVLEVMATHALIPSAMLKHLRDWIKNGQA